MIRTTWPGTAEDQAINAAFEEGRLAGLAEAARIAEQPHTITGPIKGPDGIARVKQHIAAAIRARIEEGA